MTREILTYPISKEQMKEELRYCAQHFRALGYDNCEVLFGSSWGNNYYATSEWSFVEFQVLRLVEEVARVEALGFGRLGSDDLFIRLPSRELEFRFCNDSDIHISFDEPNEITEVFYQRWKSRGFKPAEWVKPEKGPPTERVRFD
jgi:hypothetical protein